MIRSASYKTSTLPAILIIGPPGSGKTTAASLMPNPYFIQIDNNIDGPWDCLSRNKVVLNAGLDIPQISDKGIPLPPEDCFQAMRRKVNQAFKEFPEMKTVVVDSLTGLAVFVEDEVRRQVGKLNEPKAPKIMDKASEGQIFNDEKNALTTSDPLRIQDWGRFSGALRQIILTLRSSGKILVVCAHIDIDKDELTGGLRKFIKCPGSFRNEIAGLFTEVWMTSIEDEVISGKRVYSRTITTVPTQSNEALGLKSSMGLPNKFTIPESKFSEYQEKFAKLYQIPTNGTQRIPDLQVIPDTATKP